MPFDEAALLNTWTRTIDPDGLGMANAIADDISAFTGETRIIVLEKMSHGRDDLARLWRDANVDTANPDSITSFYRTQFVEAYELANWHCGRLNGKPPLNYARAALFAREHGLKRVLDFGSGIGSGSLCFATLGMEVHSADVARTLLDFVASRMQRRGMHPRLIDLAADEAPRAGYFDLITCFDVLEHVPDQLVKLRELQSYLRYGGFLFVNLMNDSSDPDRPMHISSAGNWERLVWSTGMRPYWPACEGEMQVLERSRLAYVRNPLAALRAKVFG